MFGTSESILHQAFVSRIGLAVPPRRPINPRIPSFSESTRFWGALASCRGPINEVPTGKALNRRPEVGTIGWFRPTSKWVEWDESIPKTEPGWSAKGTCPWPSSAHDSHLVEEVTTWRRGRSLQTDASLFVAGHKFDQNAQQEAAPEKTDFDLILKEAREPRSIVEDVTQRSSGFCLTLQEWRATDPQVPPRSEFLCPPL